ncbi:MAG: type II secretion system minor pseudopilin GspJ [Salinisphaera sp.]|nr:type II secretion system minor pseudopilin GspJ [Salinisphaera sp.]
MKRAIGFTLIELLVALAVFALMAAMAYGGLNAMLEAKQGIDAALDRGQQLRGALFRLQTDLAQAVDRPVRDAFGDLRPAFYSRPQQGIVFTAGGWRNPLRAPRSSLQRVAYRVDDKDRLLLSHWQFLDRAPASTPRESVLLQGVKSIEWHFLNTQREWVDRWPPPDASASGPIGYGAGSGLPLAVEVRLDTAAWGRLRLLVVLAGG